MQTGVFFSLCSLGGGTTYIYSYLVIITCWFIRVGEIWWHAPPETEAIQQRAEGERSLDTGTLSCHWSKKVHQKDLVRLVLFSLFKPSIGGWFFRSFLAFSPPKNLGEDEAILTHIKNQLWVESLNQPTKTRSTPTPKVNPRRAARTVDGSGLPGGGAPLEKMPGMPSGVRIKMLIFLKFKFDVSNDWRVKEMLWGWIFWLQGVVEEYLSWF